MEVAILKIKRVFGEQIGIIHHQIQPTFDHIFGENTFKKYEFLSVNCDSQYFYYYFKLKTI